MEELRTGDFYACTGENSDAMPTIVEIISVSQDMLEPTIKNVVFRCIKSNIVYHLDIDAFFYYDEQLTPRFKKIG